MPFLDWLADGLAKLILGIIGTIVGMVLVGFVCWGFLAFVVAGLFR